MTQNNLQFDQLIFDEKEIKTRKEYLGFSIKDEELLKGLKLFINENADKLVEAFYDHLGKYKELTDLWLDRDRIERLLEAQKKYLARLFDGKYDREYFENRLHIGVTHNKVKLPTKWYMGAYNLYKTLLIPLIFQKYKSDTGRFIDSILALEKITNLDMQLAIDAYIHSYTYNLQQKTRELKLFQNALDSSMDAIIVTDLNSSIRHISNGFEKITGYKSEEVLGKKPSIIKSGYTPSTLYRAMWDSVTAKGWWNGEFVNRKKNGEHWDCDLTITTVKDETGLPYAYIGILRDITDKKRQLAYYGACEAEMEKIQNELKEAYVDTVYMLAIACEANDETTGKHVRRIQYYSEALAIEMGISSKQAEYIGISSILHDVGKIYIPENILKKPAKLTPDEWVIMKTHTLRGEHLLVNKPYFQTTREIARSHHENSDGTGYPDGLKGEKIPVAAQIVKVADIYDALTTKRQYKEAWTEESAYNEILSLSGTSLNPKIVAAFKKLFELGALKNIKEKRS